MATQHSAVVVQFWPAVIEIVKFIVSPNSAGVDGRPETERHHVRRARLGWKRRKIVVGLGCRWRISCRRRLLISFISNTGERRTKMACRLRSCF